MKYNIVILFILLLSVTLNGQHIDNFLESQKGFNPNTAVYPYSSFVDRSGRLDAPAGKHGFVTARDGHFYLENGKQIRFWGINIAKSTTFVDYKEIDKMVDMFADSGFNMVRIHHIDDADGIFSNNTEYFIAQKLDKLDYFIFKLKERGIYVCLDLNDYRTFKSSEGVVNGEKLGRGAKPYAAFDPKLLELQKDFAKRFLVEHVNKYTQLSYAKDPAIALIEIYDENGLFIRREEWGSLISPYREQLTKYWNIWLRNRYGTTKDLKNAWTNKNGQSALLAGETLENGNVRLPNMSLLTSANPSTISELTSPARVNDGAQFATEIQKSFQGAMQWYLRNIGVKVPITAVGGQDIIADVAQTAETNDYVGINYYWDHPAWNTENSWKMPSYFYLYSPLNQNIKYTFPVVVAQSKVHNTPLVIREMGYCYPNPYRSLGVIEAACYGAFLDIDAILLFTYDATNSAADNIGYFNVRLDPLRYNLVATSSRIFLENDILPSKYEIGIGYSEVDRYTFTRSNIELYYLAFMHGVSNYFDASAKQHPFDLLVTSGKSATSMRGGRHERTLAFAMTKNADLYQQAYEPTLDKAFNYNILSAFRGGIKGYNFVSSIGYDKGDIKSVGVDNDMIAGDLTAKGLTPIAVSGDAAIGFIDQSKKFALYRYGVSTDLVYRSAVDLLNEWNRSGITHSAIDNQVYVTNTKEIIRDAKQGILTLVTPKLAALAGNLNKGRAISAGAMSVSTNNPVSVFSVESFDNLPLEKSKNFLLMMTTTAENTNIKLAPAKDGPKPNKLSSLGTMPILTAGKIGQTYLTSVSINNKPVISLNILNGNMQLLVENARALLYLDTPSTKVTFYTNIVDVICHYFDGKNTKIEFKNNSFTYPTVAVRALEIKFE